MNSAYQDNFATLYIADALTGLAELPEKSVHMAVTSPPYFGLRSYLDAGHEDKGRELGTEETPEEFVEKLVAVMRGVWRVLRDDGTLWMVIGDSYAGGGRGGNPDYSPHVKQKTNSGSLRGPSPTPPGLKPKDLIGIPWMVAFALRADGWYLRSEITWAKTAPMPESVTDRPTSATEKVFLLTKKPSYFYDAEAVREPLAKSSVGRAEYYRAAHDKYGSPERGDSKHLAEGVNNAHGYAGMASGRSPNAYNPAGRNQRNFWLLGPENFRGSHFAVYPSEIPLRAIRAGTSERGVCGECGAPWRRMVERQSFERPPEKLYGGTLGHNPSGKVPGSNTRGMPDGSPRTVGWEPTCECKVYRLRPDLSEHEKAIVMREMG